MDNKITSSAQELIELARRKTAESRRELIGNITDLFLAEAVRLSDRERSLMTGILRNLIATVEMEVREELAACLKKQSGAPAGLIVALADDDVEIARPILLQGPVLRDVDLIRAIKMRGREHWLAITVRPSLAAGVGDTMIATGDDDVIEGLLRDDDAELARHAREYLVAEAERLDRFQKPLLVRADLPPDLAARLCWWVSAALRRHIARDFAIDATLLDDLVEQATLTVIVRDPASSIEDAARRLIEKLSTIAAIEPAVLIRLVRTGRIPAFIAGLAHHCEIPLALARRVTLEVDGESLAIFCRAAAISRDDLAGLYPLLQNAKEGGGQLPAAQLDSILAFYDGLTDSDARAAVTYWRRDPAFVAAIEEVATRADATPAIE